MQEECLWTALIESSDWASVQQLCSQLVTAGQKFVADHGGLEMNIALDSD